MSEFLKYEGRLSQARHQKREIEIRIRGQVTALRNELDPLAPPSLLDGEVIANTGLAIAQLLADLRAVESEISEINRLLGRA